MANEYPFAYPFSGQAPVYEITTPVNTNQQGPSRQLKPGSGDIQENHQQRYVVEFRVSMAGGTAPEAQPILDTSSDGTNWRPVATGTNRVGVGTYFECKEIDNTGLAQYVRARLIVGGGVPGNTTCLVRLLSTGPFKVQAL